MQLKMFVLFDKILKKYVKLLKKAIYWKNNKQGAQYSKDNNF
jgi:hypothetical protein